MFVDGGQEALFLFHLNILPIFNEKNNKYCHIAIFCEAPPLLPLLWRNRGVLVVLRFCFLLCGTGRILIYCTLLYLLEEIEKLLSATADQLNALGIGIRP
jgi:hypothetical protein